MKSGGHAPFEGSSSADGGVTIDMRLFDGVESLGDNAEGEITRVGTGGRWGEVYKKLEPLGKTVIGGRDRRVGVGGLLLGGEFLHKTLVSETADYFLSQVEYHSSQGDMAGQLTTSITTK